MKAQTGAKCEKQRQKDVAEPVPSLQTPYIMVTIPKTWQK
jgi:hypothetical protein